MRHWVEGQSRPQHRSECYLLEEVEKSQLIRLQPPPIGNPNVNKILWKHYWNVCGVYLLINRVITFANSMFIAGWNKIFNFNSNLIHNPDYFFAPCLTTFNVSNNFWGGSQSLYEIGLSLEPNHHDQVPMVQIPDCLRVNSLWKSVIFFQRN